MAHRLWLRLARMVSQDIKSSKSSLARLERQNRQERKATMPVVAPGGPVVSMTTYGKRLESTYLSLESIALGTLLPSRLILWLEDQAEFDNRPDTLRRLEERGLEVKLAARFGPHTKYYPYLESQSEASLNIPLVTADDDTLYPARWLKGLVDSFQASPNVVSCYRAHVVKLQDNGFANYVSWRRCRSTAPSFANFATGVSGVIYPPELQKKIKEAGLGFVAVCPKADDVWLHVQALRAGYMIKQVKAWEQTFPVLPGTQESGLLQQNVHGSQNDIQIRNTYTEEDMTLIRASEQ